MTVPLGMTTKLVEVTLSHKYRANEDGTIAGGQCLYGSKVKQKWLAVCFMIATVISSPGTALYHKLAVFTHGGILWHDLKLTGCVLAILLGLVILGGIKRIAGSDFAYCYIYGLCIYHRHLPSSFKRRQHRPIILSIFEYAFTGLRRRVDSLSEFAAFNRGVNRGLFSMKLAGSG